MRDYDDERSILTRWQEMVRKSDRMRWELQRLRRVLAAAKDVAQDEHDPNTWMELNAAIEAAEVDDGNV